MSIRKYLFASLTGLVLIIAGLLTFQSAFIFLNSFGHVQEKIMLNLGKHAIEIAKPLQLTFGYHVTSDWQQIPAPVREKFGKSPKEVNVRHSIYEDWIYIQPPEKAYSLMRVEHQGKTVFVSRYHEDMHAAVGYEGCFDPTDPMILIILSGISLLVIFILALQLIFKKIASPVEQLTQWANQLSLEKPYSDKPDFQFKELNQLALLLEENMRSMASSLKREQDFLRYASHELRTPISVIRSNSALFEKVNPNPSKEERTIRDRISRASLTMKSMTETLLWLSRENEPVMEQQAVQLGDMINQLNRELEYLLTGKAVSVDLQLDNSTIVVAATPCLIVLNNLIRNAFQHTQQGQIEIIQQGSQLRIINQQSSEAEESSPANELGFGLGMQLVNKLVEQFNWHFETRQQEEKFIADIRFSHPRKE